MATYYAQNAAAANINAASVWYDAPSGGNAVTLTLNANGNTGFWGISGDAAAVLCANGKSITINVNTNVGTLRNDAFVGTGGTATAGGAFTLNSGLTLTANCVSGAANLVLMPLSANSTTTVNGNLTSTVNNGYTLFVNSGSPTPSQVFNINGTLTSNAGGTVYVGSTCSINITGSIVNNGGLIIYFVNSGGFHTITGTHTSPGGGDYIATFSGNIQSLGVVTIIGNVVGRPTGTSPSINVVGAGILLTVYGTATGGPAGSPAIQNSGSTVYATRAKGGDTSAGGPGVWSVAQNQPSTSFSAVLGITTVREIEYGDLGASPTNGPIRLEDSTSNQAILYRFGTTKKTLTDPASTGTLPATNNVRSGTVYAAGNLTGTLAMPSAAQVLSGVAVGSTTGTAVIDSASIQSACAAAITAFSAGRLGNCATVASTSQQLSNAVNM